MMLAGSSHAADESAEKTTSLLELSSQEANAVAAAATTEVDELDEAEQFLASFAWQKEGPGSLNQWATVDYPTGYLFLDGSDAARFMEAIGNLPDEYVGFVAPESLDWFVLFQFDDCGYVEDTDKSDLDADALLESLQENDAFSNDARRAQGISELFTEGWAVPPRYNESTNNLEWALTLRDSEGNKTVNYMTKLLGRDGIMHVTLVCDPEDLQSVLADYQLIVSGHKYRAGNSYAEYVEGDKLAGYGLNALVAGGALYGASKLGLLAKIGLFFKKGFKLIIVGVIAVGAFFKRLVFGRSE